MVAEDVPKCRWSKPRLMLFPSIPLLLLATGAVSLAMSRWVTGSRWHVGIWLAVMICAASWTAMEAAESPLMPASGDGAPAWLSDPFSRAGQWLGLGFSTLLGLGTLGAKTPPHRVRCRLASLCLVSCGVMLVSAAPDLVAMFLSTELIQVALLTLRRTERTEEWTACIREPHDEESAIQWSSISVSCCLWLGLGLLVVLTGTTEFTELRAVLSDSYLGTRHAAAQGSRLGLLAMGLIVVGLGARMGLAPGTGTLLPDDSRGSYWTLGVERLAGQLVGVLALARLLGFVWVGYRDELFVMLLTMGLLTVVVAAGMLGTGLARGEGRLRRWATALVMLQSGGMTVGFLAVQAELAAPEQGLAATGQPGALALLFFALIGSQLAAGGLFLVLSGLSTPERDVEFVEELQGLGRHSPIAGAGLVAVGASLAGLPPLWGFWGNWFLALAGLNVRANTESGTVAPQIGLMVLVAAVMLAQVVALAVVLRIGQTVFLEPPIARARPGERTAAMSAGLICGLCLFLVGMAPARMLALVSTISPPRVPSPPQEPAGQSRGNSTANRSAALMP